MNLRYDQLYEIVNNMDYQDISKFCQSHPEFAKFCRSEVGLRLIQQKQRRYREQRVDNLLNSLKQMRHDLNLDRFMASMVKFYRERISRYPYLALGADYSFLIPKKDIEAYWQIKKEVFNEFMQRHPELQGKAKLSDGNGALIYDFQMSIELYRQLEPEIEEIIFETGKRFLLSHYYLVQKIEQLTKTHIYLF